MADSPTPYRLAEVEPGCGQCDHIYDDAYACEGCQRDGTRVSLTDRVFVDPIERADVQALEEERDALRELVRILSEPGMDTITTYAKANGWVPVEDERLTAVFRAALEPEETPE